MKVLLLVDIQNDFCPGGALAVANGDETVAVANKLMASGEFDFVVASLDWHPKNHTSFAVNHPDSKIFETISLEYPGGKKLSQTLWPVHCVERSYGSQLHDDLDRSKIDLLIEKGTNPNIDSYSAFFDNGRLQETGLRQALQELAAQHNQTLQDVELYVCGLATDYCVKATALDARYLNINTTLVLDACRAVNLNPGDDLAALRELSSNGVHISDSRSVLGRDISLAREQRPAPTLHP